jgi:hypothetical protein
MREPVMLLYDYLDLLNSVLFHHPESKLIRELQRLGETELDGGRLGVLIIPDDARFAIRFNGESFALMPDDPPAPLVWRVQRADLERVVDDPGRYIEHPERLDWEWLRAASSTRSATQQGAARLA